MATAVTALLSGINETIPSYIVLEEDGTSRLTLEDGGGSLLLEESVVPPVNTVAPAVTGTATVGSLLTCSTGTWTVAGSSTFTYQWQRGGANIASATSNTYTLVYSDGGTNVGCVVTDTDTDLSSASASSNTVSVPGVSSVFPSTAATTLLLLFDYGA